MNKYNPKAKQTIANLHFGNIGIKKVRDAIGIMDSGIVDEMYTEIVSDEDYAKDKVYTFSKTTCAAGWAKNVNGVCQPIIPKEIVCQSGYTKDANGNCVMDWIPIPRVCPDGYTSDANGNCIIVINNLSDACPAGYYKDSNGKCVPLGDVYVPTRCPDGFVKVGEDCVGKPNGQGVSEVAMLVCPAGYQKDATGLRCVPMPASPAATCPAGYVRDLTKGGICVPKPTSPVLGGGGGGATRPTPKTDAEPTTPVVTPTPTVAKKDKDKMKWILIGVAVLVIGAATAYFIIKP